MSPARAEAEPPAGPGLDPDGFCLECDKQWPDHAPDCSSAAPSPASPAETREGRAWEEGFKAGGRWTLLDEEWYEDTQSFEDDDLPPRPPKPSNPYAAASPDVSLPGEQPRGEERKPGRWWRVVAADGSLWSESSDEKENRRALKSAPGGGTLQRQYVTEPKGEWRTLKTRPAAPALPGERADEEGEKP